MLLFHDFLTLSDLCLFSGIYLLVYGRFRRISKCPAV